MIDCVFELECRKRKSDSIGHIVVSHSKDPELANLLCYDQRGFLMKLGSMSLLRRKTLQGEGNNLIGQI